MCSAEHARRTSCHPELVPLRCCLRLCETVKQLPCPYHKCFLCLRNALRDSGLINLKERGPVQIPPCFAVQRFRAAWIHNFPRGTSQTGLKVSRIESSFEQLEQHRRRFTKGMQKREGFRASPICYHARLVKVKNVSADVSKRQALSNLIRCSRSRNPIMKYDSLSTLMSRVDVGASLAGLWHRRDVPLFPIISGWEWSENRLKRLLSCVGISKLLEWFLLFFRTMWPPVTQKTVASLRMAERCVYN